MTKNLNINSLLTLSPPNLHSIQPVADTITLPDTYEFILTSSILHLETSYPFTRRRVLFTWTPVLPVLLHFYRRLLPWGIHIIRTWNVHTSKSLSAVIGDVMLIPHEARRFWQIGLCKLKAQTFLASFIYLQQAFDLFNTS